VFFSLNLWFSLIKSEKLTGQMAFSLNSKFYFNVLIDLAFRMLCFSDEKDLIKFHSYHQCLECGQKFSALIGIFSCQTVGFPQETNSHVLK